MGEKEPFRGDLTASLFSLFDVIWKKRTFSALREQEKTND